MTLETTTDRHEDCVGTLFVLVALEPRSYAEAIAQAVAALRPGLEVLVVEPDDLPTGGALWTPALVFCAGPRPEDCDAAVRWAQFDPYDEPEVIRVDGIPHRFPGLDLEILLGLIDRICEGAA